MTAHPAEAELSALPSTPWSLGRVVAAWAERGAQLPVAVVVSIFDDLCEDMEDAPRLEPPPARRRPLALDDVQIDAHGIARLTVEPDDHVNDVSRLLYDALTAGAGDVAVPAAVWPLLEQAMAEDPAVRPPGPVMVRATLRASLGAPARRDEVLGCCALTDVPVPSVVEASSFGPAVMLPPAEEFDVASAGLAGANLVSNAGCVEVAARSPVPADEDVDLGSMLPVDRTVLDAATIFDANPPVFASEGSGDLPSAGDSQDLPSRKVVRHEMPRRSPVSLPAAPEARVGPAGMTPSEHHSGIIVPTEGRLGVWAIGILFVIAGALLAWMLGLLEV